MRTAARVDANQNQVIAALRRVGATVEPIHMLGKGRPDLLVGFRGQNYLLELKDGSKPPSARRLTPDEERWRADWRGQAAVAGDIESALRCIGALEPG